MQVDQATLSGYIGGEMEVQNQAEGYIYRGGIADVFHDVVNEQIVVTLSWMAKGEGELPLPSGWVRSDRRVYEMSTLICSLSPISDGRLLLAAPIVGELAVFFPPNGSKLDQSKIKEATTS